MFFVCTDLQSIPWLIDSIWEAKLFHIPPEYGCHQGFFLHVLLFLSHSIHTDPFCSISLLCTWQSNYLCLYSSPELWPWWYYPKSFIKGQVPKFQYHLISHSLYSFKLPCVNFSLHTPTLALSLYLLFPQHFFNPGIQMLGALVQTTFFHWCVCVSYVLTFTLEVETDDRRVEDFEDWSSRVSWSGRNRA